MDQVYGRGACENTEYAFYRRVPRQTLYEIMCSKGNHLRFSSCHNKFFEFFIKIMSFTFLHIVSSVKYYIIAVLHNKIMII